MQRVHLHRVFLSTMRLNGEDFHSAFWDKALLSTQLANIVSRSRRRRIDTTSRRLLPLN